MIQWAICTSQNTKTCNTVVEVGHGYNSLVPYKPSLSIEVSGFC